MSVTCTTCGKPFEISEEDRASRQAFAPTLSGKTYDLPDPIDCPDCRHQRRCAFRNERTLYPRTCDLCGKSMVTIYSGDKPFPVYCQTCWWGDGWDASVHAREVDFSRPFFEQLQELQDVVPRLSLNNARPENSDFCNQCIDNKDCYLLFAADENRDSMYGYWINRCEDTFNASNLADCRLCSDVIDCENSYHCIASQDLVNCSDCFFCYNLIGCKNCFRCAGLRNKEYCIDNEPFSKEEYEKKLAELWTPGSYDSYQALWAQFPEIKLRVPHKYIHTVNAENCSGDYVSNSKDCHFCFDILGSEKCRYAFNLVHNQFNCVDVSYSTNSRNVLETMSIEGEETCFSILTWYSSDAWYCDSVQQCKHVFGCTGIRHKEHCILNKEYSEEEYEKLLGQVIDHMIKHGEWGRFFPRSMSTFAYNETVAQDYYPLTKEQALAIGYEWKDDIDYTLDVEKVIDADRLPDNTADIPDDVLNWAIACSETGRPFRLQKRELEFYREQGLPIPRIHPDQRFANRMAMRNPRVLHDRTCGKCGVVLQSTYAPDRPETIYCEPCYLAAVY